VTGGPSPSFLPGAVKNGGGGREKEGGDQLLRPPEGKKGMGLSAEKYVKGGSSALAYGKRKKIISSTFQKKANWKRTGGDSKKKKKCEAPKRSGVVS